jgi:7-alpha-hydroxysteroid dehydrogenase
VTDGGRLAGRTAIVTGASRGLGAAIASALAAEGAAVGLAARTVRPGDDSLPGSVEETAETIRAAGGSALAVACDVTVDDDLVRLVGRVTAELGPVDVLVNNAAATVPGRPGRRPPPLGSAPEDGAVPPPALAIPLKAVHTQFAVNLFGPWRLMQLVLPGMVERGAGSVVNVSSEAARMPGPPVAYGASKLALEHLTQSAAADVAGTGVAVNALAPSLPIATPGLAWMGADHGELVSAESFAEATLRLILAGPDTTGEVLHSEDVLHPELGRRGWLGAT